MYGRAFTVGLLSVLSIIPFAQAGSGGWVEFTNETTLRLLKPDGTYYGSDAAEKRFSFGDVDNDGDLDLVVARKTESSQTCSPNPSLCHNRLFMHEGTAEGWPIDHVFVDRSAQYTFLADDGGQGFNDVTNSRKADLVDVDGDGWLDIVTASGVGDGLPKTISHPRVYMNLGEVAGIWQGFRYEEARIPQLFTNPGGLAVAPRFCALATGDVTGDDMPDLYFGDYDSADTAPPENASHDLDDRLLINNGNGFFTDSLTTRMTATMLDSAFSMAAVIDDMNGDGVKDVVKDTALQTPQRVSISYNNPANEGFFNQFQVVIGAAPYHTTTGDLNNDGRLDLVITDDGVDFYLLNQGGSPTASWSSVMNFNSPSEFGGDSVVYDLNKDGFKDVLITDHDADFTGCSRRLHIYRNLGNLPNPTLQEQGGAAPWTPNGTHDVAVFDIDGDTWPDMIIGTCAGFQIWMNEPPFGLVFSYPQGLPGFVQAEEQHVFQVLLEPFGGGTTVPGSGELHYSVNDGPFQSVAMTPLGGDLYQAALPAVECPQTVAWYVSAELSGGGTFTDPPGGAASAYIAIAAGGNGVTFEDNIEGDVSAWSVVNGGGLSAGGWQQADPNGTIQSGNLAAPENDATASEGAVMAFVTQNGTPGGAVGLADVDGGPTDLLSPTLDLAGSDATISFSYWFYSTGGTIDSLQVDVSNNNGANWVLVDTLGPTASSWDSYNFRVNDFVASTSTVRVRFRANDTPNDSITEAGIDNFSLGEPQCPPAGDCNNDLAVDLADHGEFHGCLDGPNGGLGTGCGCFDFDENLAIDLRDFRELQIAIDN